MSVRREIAEEAGIVVENVKYFQSQSWPLPQNSLMLGCTAVAMPGSEKVLTIFLVYQIPIHFFYSAGYRQE